MGNVAGRSGASASGATVPSPAVAPRQSKSPEFFVQPLRSAPGIPDNLILRLEPEAAIGLYHYIFALCFSTIYLTDLVIVPLYPFDQMDNACLKVGLPISHYCYYTAVLDAETFTVLKTWPYHLVLCWGFTPTTFQLKAFLVPPEDTGEEKKEDDLLGGGGPRVLIPTPSLRNIKVPEGSAEIEAVVMRTTQVRLSQFM